MLAIGYYDLPNFIRVPGEDLPHVSHYYTDAHPCYRRRVVVVGGKNSAAEASYPARYVRTRRSKASRGLKEELGPTSEAGPKGKNAPSAKDGTGKGAGQGRPVRARAGTAGGQSTAGEGSAQLTTKLRAAWEGRRRSRSTASSRAITDRAPQRADRGDRRQRVRWRTAPAATVAFVREHGVWRDQGLLGRSAAGRTGRDQRAATARR